MKEFIEAFKALRHAPLAFWLCVFAFTFDGMAYFGVLPLMKPFLGSDLGVKPQYASMWVSMFTGALTIAMLLVGSLENKLGIRKSLILALFLSTVGRLIYSSSPFVGGLAGIGLGLTVLATGEAIVQVICYAGVKRYTTEKTSSMGYALLYAGLNFGAILTGPMSSKVRTTQDIAFKAGTSKLSGFNAVNWVCVGITALTLIVFAIFMTKKAESKVARVSNTVEAESVSSDKEKAYRENAPPTKTAAKSPWKDMRFMFFIFALLPVRTLFAHQWLTMPEYVLRSYSQDVADHMEVFVDSVNPLVVFLGLPIIAAATKKFHVLNMMMVGSLVSAAATFLLCIGGTNVGMLVAYFIVFSIGEAIWSSRFMEYAAEIAPEGRVAQYMGVASLPWFVAKSTTGFYSGFLLEHFVPKDGPKNGVALWLIYGLIAMLSPLALIAARKWLRTGMQMKAA